MEEGYLNKFAKFVEKNSPTILTVLGVAGVVSTTVFAIQATIESRDIVEEIDDWDDYSVLDKAKVIGPKYIPTIVMGTATSACIIGAHVVDTKRGMALAGAYAIADASLHEYKDKIEETFGEKKAQKIREDISQDKVKQSEYDPEKVEILEDGNVVLCFDTVSGRYFMSSIERLKRIQADMNLLLTEDGEFVSLNDFYSHVGLSDIAIGDDLGWSLHGNGLVNINYDAVISQDEKPCIALVYEVRPKYHYYY